MTSPGQPSGQFTAAQLAALAALIAAQASVRRQLTATAVAGAVTPFRLLSPGDWWDPKKVGAAIAAALRIVQPAQRQAARVTDAYIARAANIMTGRPTKTVGVVDVTALRRTITEQTARALLDGTAKSPFVVLGDSHDGPADTIDARAPMAVPELAQSARARAEARRRAEAVPLDPREPYGRVADQFRFQVIAKGVPEEQATRNAVVRIGATAQTDVTLAVREQYRKSTGPIKGIRGYRRVLHPEETETGPCGLCVVAAHRLYHVEDLHPIHARCACEVLPVIGDLDPGIVLTNADFQALYAAAGSTGGGKRQGGALKKIRVALAENGEIGPVLVDADQHHRGPRDVAKTVVPDPKVSARAELDALDKSYARLQRRKQAGEDVDRPLTWQENRIAQLHRVLAGVS